MNPENWPCGGCRNFKFHTEDEGMCLKVAEIANRMVPWAPWHTACGNYFQPKPTVGVVFDFATKLGEYLRLW